MMRVALFVLLLAVPTLAQIKPSYQAVVDNWHWVDVKNPDPVKGVEYGETCGIEPRGVLTVVGVWPAKRQALVRYEGGSNAGGTACPSGVLFFIAYEHLLQLDRYTPPPPAPPPPPKYNREQIEDRARVRRILKGATQ